MPKADQMLPIVSKKTYEAEREGKVSFSTRGTPEVAKRPIAHAGQREEAQVEQERLEETRHAKLLPAIKAKKKWANLARFTR